MLLPPPARGGRAATVPDTVAAFISMATAADGSLVWGADATAPLVAPWGATGLDAVDLGTVGAMWPEGAVEATMAALNKLAATETHDRLNVLPLPRPAASGPSAPQTPAATPALTPAQPGARPPGAPASASSSSSPSSTASSSSSPSSSSLSSMQSAPPPAGRDGLGDDDQVVGQPAGQDAGGQGVFVPDPVPDPGLVENELSDDGKAKRRRTSRTKALMAAEPVVASEVAQIVTQIDIASESDDDADRERRRATKRASAKKGTKKQGAANSQAVSVLSAHALSRPRGPGGHFLPANAGAAAHAPPVPASDAPR
jgi:hypothetical protein